MFYAADVAADAAASDNAAAADNAAADNAAAAKMTHFKRHNFVSFLALFVRKKYYFQEQYLQLN